MKFLILVLLLTPAVAFTDFVGEYESIAVVYDGALDEVSLKVTIQITQGLYRIFVREIYAEKEHSVTAYAPLMNPFSDDNTQLFFWSDDDPLAIEHYPMENHLIMYYVEDNAPTPSFFCVLRKKER